MKICILTGKFGMGHFTAAKAIKQQLDCSLDAEVEIIDWLQYASPRFADKYYAFYTFLVNKGGDFYNSWYRFFENKKSNKKPELSHYFLWCFSKFMEDKNPDLIISTLPLCSQIVSHYKEKTTCKIPLVTCVTDITGHSEWINKNTDIYLVGSQTVKEKFIEKGVLPDNIYETGIPVRLDFINDTPSDIKETQSTKKNILIMGGGLGMLPENPEFYEGLDLLPNVKITVITGKNQKLFQLLSGRYQNIKVFGFIENICDYMKQADLIITKPGGITTFEAIHTELPIVALNPLLQQEIYNAQYIQDMQIGTVVRGNSEQCLEDITNLLDYGKLEDYKCNLRRIKNHLEDRSLPKILKYVIYNNYKTIAGFSSTHKNKSEGIKINEKISFNI